MSAWLCRKATLSLVVDVIKSDDFKEYDVDGYANKSKDDLIEILADLNTKSLNCRYGKSPYHILKNREYINLNVDEGQRHKSVACYLYQTCECEEILEHSLFKALSKWNGDGRGKYEPTWSQYHWDIDDPY